MELPYAYGMDDYRVVDESDESRLAWAEPEPTALDPPARWPDHRSGTCFDRESTSMRRACVDPLAAHLGADDVVHEVRHQRTGYHTDLVFADLNPDGVADRRRLVPGGEPLHDPLQRFRVWEWVRENGPVPHDCAIDPGRYADSAKNRKHVTALEISGYLAKTSTGHLVAAVPPKIADLHAVELKLRDWETALDQADRANRFDGYDSAPLWKRLRYGYADYRWVALDAGAVPRALEQGCRSRFEDRGVGLLGIAEGGAVVEHIDAAHEPRESYTGDRAWVESQLWSRLEFEDLETEADETGGSGAQAGLLAYQDGGG